MVVVVGVLLSCGPIGCSESGSGDVGAPGIGVEDLDLSGGDELELPVAWPDALAPTDDFEFVSQDQIVPKNTSDARESYTIIGVSQASAEEIVSDWRDRLTGEGWRIAQDIVSGEAGWLTAETGLTFGSNFKVQVSPNPDGEGSMVTLTYLPGG